MLLETLRKIRSARDTTGLFVKLGYAAECCPYDHGAIVVARWGGFKVVATYATNPRDEVRSLAHTLATSSVRGLAVALGPSNQLFITAPRLGAAGLNRLLVVDLRNPTPDTLQHLANFSPKGKTTGLAHALRIDELLASEVAGERFFRALHLLLARMASALGHRGTAADRRMVALLHLTRVLFLYFVQAKGWLNDQLDYLKAQLDDALATNSHFHKTILNQLFFDTLNRPAAARRHGRRLGNIPYLNGGLFEQHPAERRLGGVIYTNALWRDAFDGVFEKFRFCVREADEVNAIAPDMLGRVFERVMEPVARHESGTFYTPETVVRQVVDAAIETALLGSSRLPPEVVHRLVRRRPVDRDTWPRARRSLWSLRVLDPAVGSGAFLLGVLDSLTDMQLSLLRDRSPRTRLQIRRRIIRQNLFGVDLNPIAVRLAELRLWLAVVADDPTTDITKIQPLPNLDGVVRQGDSLLDPLGAARALGCSTVSEISSKVAAVRDTRKLVFAARGNEQHGVLRRLRNAEYTLARALLDTAREQTDHKLRELASAARGRDLFGHRSRLTAAQQIVYRTLRFHRAALKQVLARVRDGALPFFSFEVHTPEILAGGGFSVVVGNPPWVRAERLTTETKQALKKRFQWWRGEGGRGFSHPPDLALAFLERALELTAPGGGVGFLLPSKITSAQYAEQARRHLVRETTVRYLHRIPEKDAAHFGATTYPLGLVLGRRKPESHHYVRLSFENGSDIGEPELTNQRQSRMSTGCLVGRVRQKDLDQAGPWVLVSDRQRRALDTFRESGTPLAQLARPSLGVKTGANELLVGRLLEVRKTTSVIRFHNNEVEIESRLIRSVVRGRDVAPFQALPKRVILWAYAGGKPLATLPSLTRAYIERHKTQLCKRADIGDGPPWVLFRLRAALSPNRVVWADIVRRPAACALDATHAASALPLNTCYLSCAPDAQSALVIAAVLNSTWAHALIVATADEARGGYRRFNARVASAIPIPPTGDKATELAQLSATAHTRERSDQQELDDAVAQALALPAVTCDALKHLVRNHR